MANDNELTVKYSKKENDFMIYYPSSSDGHVLNEYIFNLKGSSGLTLIEELKNRGYDITTLRLSIKKIRKDDKEE